VLSLPLARPWLRLAALAAIALVALAAALGAQAATADPAPQAPSVAFVEEEDEGGAEGEAEAEGDDGEELEEEEEAEPPPGDVCPLRSASAHAVTGHDKLRLTIGYTANEPFHARIEIKQGPARIDSVQRHFGPSGVLRLSSKLDEQRKGGRLAVRIKPASGGFGCPSRRLVLFPR
jgi:hypothetical protein